MASIDQNVASTDPLERGDTIKEDWLREYIAQSNSTDYVERGCGFSVDFGGNTVQIGSSGTRANFVVIEQDNLAYPLFPVQSGDLTLQDTNGVNHVFAEYDPANDQFSYHIDTEDTGNQDVSLKIGTINTSTSSSTLLNRDPDVVVDSITDGADVTHTGELADNADVRTDEQIEDVVGALVAGGTNITASYDDGAGTLTIDTSALTEEEVEDVVDGLLTAGSGIDLAYDDGANTLTVSVAESQLSFFDGTDITADVNNTNTTSEVVTLNQQADDGTDRVLIQKADGTNMAELYSDGTNTVLNPLSGNIDLTGALSVDQLLTTPAGVTLTKDSDQSVSGTTLTTITFENASEMNANADAFADLANNRITIPNNDYSRAWFKLSVFTSTDAQINSFMIEKNQSTVYNGSGYHNATISGVRVYTLSTGAVDVSSGDDFRGRIIVQDAETLKNNASTYLQGWAV